jgi:hypothetical protein
MGVGVPQLLILLTVSPLLVGCSISVISVNGWHELFEPHSYRCNMLGAAAVTRESGPVVRYMSEVCRFSVSNVGTVLCLAPHYGNLSWFSVFSMKSTAQWRDSLVSTCSSCPCAKKVLQYMLVALFCCCGCSMVHTCRIGVGRLHLGTCFTIFAHIQLMCKPVHVQIVSAGYLRQYTYSTYRNVITVSLLHISQHI